jgi:hypothetical protein
LELSEQAGSSIPTAFLVLLVFWLAIIFTSFAFVLRSLPALSAIFAVTALDIFLIGRSRLRPRQPKASPAFGPHSFKGISRLLLGTRVGRDPHFAINSQKQNIARYVVSEF